MLKAIVTLSLALQGSAWAHHAASLYNGGHLKVINGEVARLAFRSPHVELYVVDGKGERWTVSMSSPAQAKADGRRRTMMGLLPGVTVQVSGWVHRLKNREIRMQELIFSDGTVLEGMDNVGEAPADQKTLKRLLGNDRWLAVQDPGAEPRQASDLEAWVTANRPLERLALELHGRRAFFLGLAGAEGSRYPGISAHLDCLPKRLPQRVFDGLAEDDAILTYLQSYNGALARYLESQLETCGD
ncbi:MAG: DUF6152 family protein [Pseudomonadota bacterium]